MPHHPHNPIRSEVSPLFLKEYSEDAKVLNGLGSFKNLNLNLCMELIRGSEGGQPGQSAVTEELSLIVLKIFQ